MKTFRIFLFILLVSAALPFTARSQQVGIKSNLVYWGTATPNLGIEFKTGIRTSLDVVGGWNPFTFSDNKKFKHWMVQPEFRIWNCETFIRGFWGIHAHYGQFNVGNWNLPLGIFSGLKDSRYQGYAVGGGISYGYQWYLGPHWNLEATFGFGYAYLNYDRYSYEKCGPELQHGHKHYIGPTRLGLSFVYLIKSKK